MLFSPVETMLALRYIRARRSEGFISVIAWFSLLGITLGVATLIIVMSVMNGFRTELINRILGLNGHLAIYQSTSTGIEDYHQLTLKLTEWPGVVAVTPQVEGQVMASVNGNNLGAVVRGVIWSDLAARKPLWSSLDDAEIAAFRDDKAVLIGKTMAFNLGLRVGDTMTILAPRGRATAFGTLPVRRNVKIGGIFDVGMYEYDSAFIFMPLDISQAFFGLDDSVTGIELYARNPLQIQQMKGAISAELGTDKRVFDWRDRNASFLNALAVERNDDVPYPHSDYSGGGL